MMKRAWTYFSLAFAAFACMAIVGVSTSFAVTHTVLCKENETPCEYQNVYHEGEVIGAEATASSGEFEIGINGAGPGYHITCSHSELDATIGVPEGETQPISITSWTLGQAGEPCMSTFLYPSTECTTAVAEGLPYKAELNEGILKVLSPSFHFL